MLQNLQQNKIVAVALHSNCNNWMTGALVLLLRADDLGKCSPPNEKK
jgi:hypothetical protein